MFSQMGWSIHNHSSSPWCILLYHQQWQLLPIICLWIEIVLIQWLTYFTIMNYQDLVPCWYLMACKSIKLSKSWCTTLQAQILIPCPMGQLQPWGWWMAPWQDAKRLWGPWSLDWSWWMWASLWAVAFLRFSSGFNAPPHANVNAVSLTNIFYDRPFLS